MRFLTSPVYHTGLFLSRRWGGLRPPFPAFVLPVSSSPPRRVPRRSLAGGLRPPPEDAGVFSFLLPVGLSVRPAPRPGAGRRSAPCPVSCPPAVVGPSLRAGPYHKNRRGGFLLYLCPALVGTRSASLACAVRAGYLPVADTGCAEHACTQASPAP